ncbi:MAG: transcriptional coactivator p15/PC4 family protein [Leptospiraceae bacterium]|nr:transcriptional coactivator p15/PC4 family protein [Leptospiraceae bacterium]
MADSEIIAEWDKNKVEKIRISLGKYKGKKLLDIRVWFLTEGNNYAPAKKGIALPVEQLPQLMEALAKVEEHLKKSS